MVLAVHSTYDQSIENFGVNYKLAILEVKVRFILDGENETATALDWNNSNKSISYGERVTVKSSSAK